MPQVTEKPSLDIVPTAPAPLELTQPEEIKLEFADEQNFDYSSLDADTARLAKESAIEIKAREKAIWENIIAIGNRLIEVKAALPHGSFESWVNREFGWNSATARKYMTISKEIEPNRAYGNVLPNSMKALYQLASSLSNTDEETKEAILEQVQQETEEKGKPLTEKEIKELPLVKQLQAEKEALKAEKKKIEEEKNQMEESLFSLEFQKTTWDEKQTNLTKRVAILSEQYESEIQKAKDTKEEYHKKLELVQKEASKLVSKEKSLNALIEKQLEEKEKALRENLTQELKDKKIQEIAQEKERLEKEKKELERKVKLAKDQVEHLEMLEAQKEARKPQVLDDIFELFQQIERTIVGESDLVLSPPSPEYVVRYKLIIDKLKSTTNALEKVLDMVSPHEGNIIDIEGT